MTSKNIVISELDSGIMQLSAKAQKWSGDLSDAERKIRNLNSQREDCYLQLAEIHLPELDKEVVANSIREVRDLVSGIYSQKEEKRTSLEFEIKRTKTEISSLEDKLSQTTDAISINEQEKATLRARTDEILASNKEYNMKGERFEKMDAEIARDSKLQDTQEAKAKENLERFKGNVVFNYLLEKKFGTSEYVKGMLEVLDRKLATEYNFFEEKRKADRWENLPSAIQSDIERRSDEASEIQTYLIQTQENAARETGLDNVINALDGLEVIRDDLAKKISTTNRAYTSATTQLENLDSDKDPYHASAIKKLDAHFKSQTLTELKEKAKETKTPKDDELVSNISELDLKIESEQRQAKEYQTQRDSYANMKRDLERVKSRLDSEGCFSSRSYFTTNSSDLVARFVAGSLNEHSLFSSIQSNHRKESPPPTPTYRSPSYGGSRSGSSFGGGFGGGSRSTSGGFGGGGRRTVGGF